jgi:hypothetical protein
MSVKVSWFDNEHTIICYQFTGAWTWEEYRPAYDRSIEMMDTVDYPVDFIMDMLKAPRIPQGALRELRRAADRNHPNMGLAVYVGLTFVLQEFGKLFLRVYPQSAAKYPFDFARTIEEAEEKIRQRRAQRARDAS